nr:methyl-accepting chemotaxis protein [Sphingomonas aerophila]
MLALVCVGVVIYGNSTLKAVDSSYSELVDHKLPSTTKLARVQRLGTEMVYAGYKAITYDGATETAQRTPKDEAKAYQSAKELLIEAHQLRPDLDAQLKDIEANLDRVHEVTSNAITLGLGNDNAAATRGMAGADDALGAMGATLVPLNNKAIADAQQESADLSAQTAASARTSLIVGVLAALAGVAAGIFAIRATITAPLARLQDAMRELAKGNNKVDVPGADRRDEVGSMAKAVQVFREAAQAQEVAAAEKKRADEQQRMVVATVSHHLDSLAAGDLTASINVDFPESYAGLKTNFNEALNALRELIASVGASTASIRTGSGEIAQASEDLARRTEGNAASLEETSAAIAQIDERLRTSAVSAAETVTRADGAIATVTKGRGRADQAVQAMGRVAESAKGIDSVIEGLDKIAFQTRVLAMNAAVEAGRAGEAGRGFAVVADLVGALAMRSEEEAKRAREQLTATQTDVVSAVEAVQNVDAALSAITGDVTQVHQLLGAMAADNQAQSSAITQIATAISTMDQSTQQNAAMVEETSAAARNLTSEVQALAEQAARFKVDARNHGRPGSSHVEALKPKHDAKSSSYMSPVKPLPAAAIPALTRPGSDDWNDF